MKWALAFSLASCLSLRALIDRRKQTRERRKKAQLPAPQSGSRTNNTSLPTTSMRNSQTRGCSSSFSLESSFSFCVLLIIPIVYRRMSSCLWSRLSLPFFLPVLSGDIFASTRSPASLFLMMSMGSSFSLGVSSSFLVLASLNSTDGWRQTKKIIILAKGAPLLSASICSVYTAQLVMKARAIHHYASPRLQLLRGDSSSPLFGLFSFAE